MIRLRDCKWYQNLMLKSRADRGWFRDFFLCCSSDAVASAVAKLNFEVKEKSLNHSFKTT